MKTTTAGIPISISELAEIFEINLETFRTWFKRQIFPFEKHPTSGSAVICPRTCVFLSFTIPLLLDGIKRAGHVPGVWNLVKSGFEWADADGGRPLLIYDFASGYMNVILDHGSTRAKLEPPDGVRIYDLQAIENRYAKSFARAKGEKRLLLADENFTSVGRVPLEEL